jgi:hypothetical protein
MVLNGFTNKSICSGCFFTSGIKTPKQKNQTPHFFPSSKKAQIAYSICGKMILKVLGNLQVQTLSQKTFEKTLRIGFVVGRPSKLHTKKEAPPLIVQNYPTQRSICLLKSDYTAQNKGQAKGYLF